MKVVYLDQNHWIEIAKFENGKACKPGTKEAVSYMTELAARGDVVFPISATHYMETWKRSNDDSRVELSESILILSGGYTTSPSKTVIKHEVVCGLIKTLGLEIEEPQLKYIGRGISHAFNLQAESSIKWPKETGLPDSDRKDFERKIIGLFEVAALSSVVNGRSLNEKQNLSFDIEFSKILEGWRGCARSISAKEVDRKIYSFILRDLALKTLPDVFNELHVSTGEAEKLKSRIFEFINLLPSQRVIFFLWKEWSKQPDLKPKTSDLNDWWAASLAIPYCDLFVTENQMHSLLSKSDEFKSKVTNSLSGACELF